MEEFFTTLGQERSDQLQFARSDMWGAYLNEIDRWSMAVTIRRRYKRGLNNFFRLYRPLADSWKVIDNSEQLNRKVIAESDNMMETVHEPELWQRLKQEYDHEAS